MRTSATRLPALFAELAEQRGRDLQSQTQRRALHPNTPNAST